MLFSKIQPMAHFLEKGKLKAYLKRLERDGYAPITEGSHADRCRFHRRWRSANGYFKCFWKDHNRILFESQHIDTRPVKLRMMPGLNIKPPDVVVSSSYAFNYKALHDLTRELDFLWEKVKASHAEFRPRMSAFKKIPVLPGIGAEFASMINAPSELAEDVHADPKALDLWKRWNDCAGALDSHLKSHRSFIDLIRKDVDGTPWFSFDICREDKKAADALFRFIMVLLKIRRQDAPKKSGGKRPRAGRKPAVDLMTQASRLQSAGRILALHFRKESAGQFQAREQKLIADGFIDAADLLWLTHEGYRVGLKKCVAYLKQNRIAPESKIKF